MTAQTDVQTMSLNSHIERNRDQLGGREGWKVGVMCLIRILVGLRLVEWLPLLLKTKFGCTVIFGSYTAFVMNLNFFSTDVHKMLSKINASCV